MNCTHVLTAFSPYESLARQGLLLAVRVNCSHVFHRFYSLFISARPESGENVPELAFLSVVGHKGRYGKTRIWQKKMFISISMD